MSLHVFVAMPFGIKAADDGRLIDFDRVYAELIRPALESVGLKVLRADEEQGAGDIRADLFQELLMADLVVADLTLDNPNVWYELGVRHTLRTRGVILVQGPRATQPFDIYTDRKLAYHVQDGAPDPKTLAADIAALAAMARNTLNAWRGRKTSPVYSLLPNLEEPDWRRLRVGNALEYWENHDEWATRIEVARNANHPEDILVLADEAPATPLRVEAHLKAGEALRRMEHFNFALEQCDLALNFAPDNHEATCQRGVCLQRLGRTDEARATYKKLIAHDQDDIDAWELLGRLDKEEWVNAWRIPGHTPEQMRSDAAYEDALLRDTIHSYSTAFRTCPGHYLSGINAVMMMHVYRELTGDARYASEAAAMAGGVAWAASCERDDANRFWALANLGGLAIIDQDPAAVGTAFREAIAHADNDWLALEATYKHIALLAHLGFRPDNVSMALATLERAMLRLKPPTSRRQPDKVFLFSGHMIDRPDRAEPRFPADKEPIAAARIDELLDNLGAGPNDLAFAQGAAGGDILFAEACLARGVPFQMLLPLEEPDFIEASILPSANGEAWRRRYLALRDKLTLPPRIMPDELGPLPCDRDGREMDAFERCNLWLLYSALTQGLSRVRFICLWNGGGGDGTGGTAHMVREVKRRTGQVSWLDTRQLW
jgi:tetratricopeptide (TPR) repeat protein